MFAVQKKFCPQHEDRGLEDEKASIYTIELLMLLSVVLIIYNGIPKKLDTQKIKKIAVIILKSS